MLSQAPAVIIVLPLMAAAVCAVLRHELVCWWIGAAVTAACFALALTLLGAVESGGTISYAMGSWTPPIGIEYRVDVFAAYMLILVSAIALVVHIYGRRSVLDEIPDGLRGWYYSMYLLCLCGLMGIVITGDTFNAFVFMEVSSLSTYVLIALGRDKRALTAAFQYLIMGTIGATFYVIGVGFLYVETGTLNMADLAVRLQPLINQPAVLAGLAFIIAGLSLKSAIFPLHLWLPNAYAYAPSVTTSFLAATATKVSLYLLIRYFFSVFGFGEALTMEGVTDILMLISIVAIVAGSVVAILQTNIKRMLAYSSVAQIGYITIGLALANLNGLTGALVHLFNHALMKGALFMLLGGVFLRVGSVRLEDLAGIGRQMPLTMAGFVLAGASMLGVPGTVGFISKWYLALGALDNGSWLLVALLMLSSLLVLIYMGRVIEAAYFRARPAGAPVLSDPPPVMLAMCWLMVGACVYFGIDTSMSVGVAREAAAVLTGATP